jgi:hypothetical protein
MTLNVDIERQYYLEQIAAGNISANTPLIDLRKMFYSSSINSNVIPVFSGNTIQDAVNAATTVSGYTYDDLYKAAVLEVTAVLEVGALMTLVANGVTSTYEVVTAAENVTAPNVAVVIQAVDETIAGCFTALGEAVDADTALTIDIVEADVSFSVTAATSLVVTPCAGLTVTYSGATTRIYDAVTGNETDVAIAVYPGAYTENIDLSTIAKVRINGVGKVTLTGNIVLDSSEQVSNIVMAAGSTAEVSGKTSTAYIDTPIAELIGVDDWRLEPQLNLPATQIMCVRHDDGGNVGDDGVTAGTGWWFAVNAGLVDPLTGAATSPVLYGYRRGYMPTVAIIADFIGDANYFNAANLALLAGKYGWKIACHSKTHGSYGPAAMSYEDAYTEIVESKRIIEDAINSADPNVHLEIDTFVVPGGFSGLNTMDDVADLDTAAGQLLAQHYKVVQNYATTQTIGVSDTRLLLSTDKTFDAVNGTTGAFIAWLKRCKTPGDRYTFFVHSVTDSGAAGISINLSFWKEIVDALYDEMRFDAGTAWTADTKPLVDGRMLPGSPLSIATANLEMDRAGQFWGGLAGGEFAFPDLTSTPRGMTKTGTASIVTNASVPNELHGYTQRNHFSFAKDTGEHTLLINKANMAKGRYLLKLDAKPGADGTPANNALKVYLARAMTLPGVTPDPATYALTLESLLTAGAWDTYFYPLCIPVDGTQLKLTLSTDEYNKAIYFSNIQLIRID